MLANHNKLATLLGGLAICFTASCSFGEKSTESTQYVTERPVSSAIGGWQIGTPGRSYTYSDEFKRKLVFSFRENGVDVFTAEFFDDNWYTWQKSFSTSYGIEQIVGNTSNRYVVAGFDQSTGETVIEGWQFPVPEGSYQAKRFPDVSSPIGTPLAITTVDVDLVGGVFVEPSSRAIVAPPQKVVLYRGTGVLLDDLVLDPEGRYLLVRDAISGGIYQLVNQQLTLLANPQGYPHLLNFIGMSFYQHGSQDRVFAVTTHGAPRNYLTFYDSDNDGVFESTTDLNENEFNETFPFRTNHETGVVGIYGRIH